MSNDVMLTQGQMFLKKDIGCISYMINTLTRKNIYLLPLGVTIGHFPFGLNVLFLSDEIGNGNWIMDTTGISNGLYNTLLSTVAIGTIDSILSSAFNIKSISDFRKYGDYYDMKFKTGAGKIRVLSFYNHGYKVAKGIKSIGK